MAAIDEIVVLVSAGRNPISGAARANRADAAAFACAKTLTGGAVTVIHAGNPANAALQDYLALGVERIEVLESADDTDVLSALVARLTNASLILTGLRAESGAGTGLLPYALASCLKRPLVNAAMDAEICDDGVVIRQFLPKGARRRVLAPISSVVTVHPSAPSHLRYADARRRAGRIDITASSAATGNTAWTGLTLEASPKMPRPLKRDAEKCGHDRMRDAISPVNRGGRVAFAGSSVDKAQVVLNYLREHRLVDF